MRPVTDVARANERKPCAAPRNSPGCSSLPASGIAATTPGRTPTQASSFKCVADEDHDDNQPPAPKYLDDGDHYPTVPITPEDDDGH
jgi:hypothetical protein